MYGARALHQSFAAKRFEYDVCAGTQTGAVSRSLLNRVRLLSEILIIGGLHDDRTVYLRNVVRVPDHDGEIS